MQAQMVLQEILGKREILVLPDRRAKLAKVACRALRVLRVSRVLMEVPDRRD